MPSYLSFRPLIAIVSAALLSGPPSFAFRAPLSDESVREAYFLGQHHDKSTAEFLAKYQRTFPMPKSGLYVSDIELFTPYAEAVDLSRQRSFSYTAQDAEEDHRKRGDVFRLRVRVWFTNTYSQNTYAQSSANRSSGAPREPFLRRDGAPSGIQVYLRQKDKVIKPLEIPGVPVYRGYTEGDLYYGFDIVLHYDADDLASEATEVTVLTPDGQQVSTQFDLDSLI